MDIKQAKEEIRRAVLAYTERTPDGALCMPLVHQRPLLLMGPPGVGKTAVFYQLAQELGINLIDGDHFCTENLVTPVLAQRLRTAFPETEFNISKRHHQVIDFL